MIAVRAGPLEAVQARSDLHPVLVSRFHPPDEDPSRQDRLTDLIRHRQGREVPDQNPLIGRELGSDSRVEAVAEKEKQLIREAIRQAGANYTEAARRLGLHPNYRHRLIRNLNLKGEMKNL